MDRCMYCGWNRQTIKNGRVVCAMCGAKKELDLYDNELPEVNPKKSNVEHIKFEDAPRSWRSRCSGDGHKMQYNEKGDLVYADNGEPADTGYRPCAKCNKFPNANGDDACIANLGKVINACCGHGDIKGYIQFDNGITIRGDFEVEYDETFKLEGD